MHRLVAARRSADAVVVRPFDSLRSGLISRKQATFAGAILALLGSAPYARASCNLIPIARKEFPSVMGGVTSPITAPDRTVELSLTPCDASAGFEPVDTDNDVEVRFEPPGPGADTVIAVSPPYTLDDCTLPGGRCAKLSFTMPDTSGVLAPDGLAGPARITVRDAGNVVVAEIGELFLPALSCDREPETVFRQFVVLPKPNLFADAVSGAQPIRATVDGGGNLLVPFDYWDNGSANSVLAETPGAPVAIFLQGNAAIPAQGVGDPNTIADVITQQASPSSFVRSFTLDGRPLPPLLRVTTSGEILGSADAIESVLRIARNDGAGGPALYDLSDRLFMDRGPVVITTLTASQNSPIPLKGLRSSSETVAFARDESRESANLNGDSDMTDLVMEILDAESGISMSTGKAVVETSTLALRKSGGFESAAGVVAAVAEGNLAAFLEYESDQDTDINSDLDFDDSFLRVYERDGTPLTAGLDFEAAADSLVSNHPMAIAGSRVFFRSPNPLVEVQENGAGGITELADVGEVVLSPDAKHVYVAAANGINSAIEAFERDAGTGRLTLIEEEPVPMVGLGPNTNQMPLAMSPDGKNVYVGLMAIENTLTVFTRDAITGALTFLEQHVDNVAGVDGLSGPVAIAASADGANLYVAALSDDSIAVFDREGTTGALTFVEVERNGVSGVTGLNNPGTVIVSPDGAHVYATANSGALTLFDRDAGDGTLAFVSTMATGATAQDAVMSPDGKHLYTIATFLTTWSRNDVTGALTSVGSQFGLDDVNGAPAKGFGMAVSADGTRLYAIGSSAVAGSLGAFSRNPRTGLLLPIAGYFDGLGGLRGLGRVITGSAISEGLAASPDGKFLYAGGAVVQGAVAVLRSDQRLRAFDTDTQTLRTGQPYATVAAAAGERAILLTPESLAAGDLNGDTDQFDDVAQIYDASGPADVVTSLGVAAKRVAISTDIAAMTVSEGSDADTDLNSDGDKNDDVLFVVEAAGGAVRNTGLAADQIAVAGRKVLYSILPLGALSIYDFDTEETAVISPSVRDFVARGSLVAFRASEFGVGEDLNGDGNSDLVMEIYDTTTGEIVNTRHAAERCNIPACEPQLPYAIDLARQTVSFLEDEVLQGNTDLNGDGDALDLVLQVFSLRARLAQNVATVQEDGVPDNDLLAEKLPQFPEEFLNDDVLFHHVREDEINLDIDDDGAVTDAIVMLVSGDGDRDGVFDDFDACVEASNPDGIDADGDALGDSACDPDPSACPPAPLAGCKAAPTGKSSVTIKNSSDDGKDSVTWKWSKGEATTLADIGNPVSGVAHYSLCIYDASAAPQPLVTAVAIAQAVCEGAPCWKAAGTKGFGYKDKAGLVTGTQQMKLTSGAGGKAKVGYKGRGALLEIPPLPATTPLVVQLVVNEGSRQECWDATFSTFTKSDGEQFKAKSD